MMAKLKERIRRGMREKSKRYKMINRVKVKDRKKKIIERFKGKRGIGFRCEWKEEGIVLKKR